ncbi:MAG TPA: autotransporter domain-containing protein [Chromatiales bacterium]|nr:autotransporter domain-containing protein [Chromatiales bacterium]
MNVIASGTPDIGTIYTIVQTTTGVSGSGYTSVTDNLLVRDFLILQNANTIQLQTIAFTSNFAGLGQTYNQIQVGTALDTLNPTATGDMRTVIDALALLPAGPQRAAFDQISGELHGTLAITSLQHTNRLLGLLSDQLRNLSPVGSGDFFAMNQLPDVRLLSAQPSATSPIRLVSASSQEDIDPGQGTASAVPYDGNMWDGWVLGYGLGGNTQGDGNATGLNWSVGGTAFGIHRWLEEGTVAGFFGAYGASFVRTAGPNQAANVDHVQLGAYLRRFDGEGNYYLLAGSWGFDDYRTTRSISFGGITRTALGKYDGQQGAVYLERGWQRSWAGAVVQPLVALQYIHIHQNGFTETGAGALNLTVGAIETDSLRSFLGGRLMWERSTRLGWLVQPTVSARWMHEFLDTSGIFAARFGVPGGPVFAPRGLDQGRDWALLGAGLNLLPRDHLALYVSYDVQLNARQAFHTGSGGLQLVW